MLHTLAIISALLIVATGLTVLILGAWQKLGLKYTAVAVSTAAGIWISAFYFAVPNLAQCDPTKSLCFVLEIYHIVRSLAFVLFHIAVGRDAIHFKKRDRRSA